MSNKGTSGRQRLDVLVVELGLLASRQEAQTAIMDGGILVDGQKITKPGTPVAESSSITLAPNWGPPKYVSRGGLKLERSLLEFAIDPSGKTCLDIGASTGGFTDCLLKHGAALVYAIDVGYGQLDWKLRNDSRVIVKERMNARALKPEDIYRPESSLATLAVIDVSFISLAKILPSVVGLLQKETMEIVCLIKPQFEAGRNQIGKGGVVRSPEVHCEVIDKLLQSAARLQLETAALTFSPLKGPAGNIEYLTCLRSATDGLAAPDIKAIVSRAHEQLN